MVFTIIYLKQTTFLVHTVLQLHLQSVLHVMLLPMLNVLYYYISASRSMCEVPSMAVFAVPYFALSLHVTQVLAE